MKNFFTKGLVLSLIFVLALILLVSCAQEKPEINTDRIVVIVSGEKVEVFYTNSSSENLKTIYNGILSEEKLAELINRLDEEKILVAKSTVGAYGDYYIQIGLLKPPLNGYIYFYTNLTDYQEEPSEWSTSITFQDTEYMGAKLGAEGLPLVDGAIYIIKVFE